MSDLTYHLECENLNQKNYLAVHIHSVRPISSKKSLLISAVALSEKSALEFLIKEHGRAMPKMSIQNVLYISPDRSFEALKMLGATGKLFYKNKKVVVDPFTFFEFYFEAETQGTDAALVTGRWKMGAQSGSLQECDYVFPADPSWIIKDSIIRSAQEDVAGKWIRTAANSPKLLSGSELAQFLEQTEDEIAVVWKGDSATISADPMPILILADRHGGFADLWFDYGPYGKIALHDPISAFWRKRDVEKGWERDLLETDFTPKIVDQSHYYCTLNKVAKSLTFLLEIGWAIIDSRGRRVLRQKRVDFDADIAQEQIIVRAKVHYDEHRVDLKDLCGAFNRRETFVELSSESVALLDRENFSAQWGDFAEQEITTEGIALKKNRFGMLLPLFEEQNLPIRPDLKQQIEKMSRCEPAVPIEPAAEFNGTLFSLPERWPAMA